MAQLVSHKNSKPSREFSAEWFTGLLARQVLPTTSMFILLILRQGFYHIFDPTSSKKSQKEKDDSN